MTDPSASRPAVCPECGKPVHADAVGCGSCGAPLDTVEKPISVEAEALGDRPPAPDTPEPSRTAPKTPASRVLVTSKPREGQQLASPTLAGVTAAEELFRVPRPGTALVRHPSRIHKVSRVGRVAVVTGACAIAAAVLVGGGLWVAAATTDETAPRATAPATSAPTTVTLPGFGRTPSWTGSGQVSAATLSDDGKLVGQITATGVTVTGADGKKATSASGTVSRLLAGTVDGRPALVAVETDTAWIFSTPGTKPVAVTLPEHATLVTRGAGVLVLSGPSLSTVGLLSAGGVTSYVPPRPGMVSAGVLEDGSARWVSARGMLYTATPAGTAANPIQLAAPADGARVTRALWTNDTTVVISWLLPDGTTRIAVHSPTDGVLLGSATTSEDNPRLLVSPNGASAMTGAVRLDLQTGSVTVPDPAFRARTALSDRAFYGGTDTDTAIQAADGTTSVIPAPHGVPIGVTAAGALLVLQPTGSVATYPTTSPSTKR